MQESLYPVVAEVVHQDDLLDEEGGTALEHAAHTPLHKKISWYGTVRYLVPTYGTYIRLTDCSVLELSPLYPEEV